MKPEGKAGYIPPGKEARLTLLSEYTQVKKLSADVDLQELANIMEGCTNPEIETICKNLPLQAGKKDFYEGLNKAREINGLPVLKMPRKKVVPKKKVKKPIPPKEEETKKEEVVPPPKKEEVEKKPIPPPPQEKTKKRRH